MDGVRSSNLSGGVLHQRGWHQPARATMEMQVAPGVSAVVRTMVQEFGREAAGQMTGDYLEHALAIAAAIPEEVSARLPPDAAANLDHCLYGAPKQTEVEEVV